ncbi:MAG: LysE family transporter [Bacteroidota bacterium]|nr:LysE family transporter [Bacteroidota bacterium]
MDLGLAFKGIIIGFAVSLPLGPIGVLCIQRTVNKNWRAGFYSGLGAASSDALYAVIAGFSLTYIINFIKVHEILFQWLAAIVVFFLGVHIFATNPVSEIRKFRRKGSTYLQDYLSTLIVTFSNPLSIFVFLAVFAGSGIVLHLSHPFDALLVLVGIFSGACSWWLILTSLVNRFRHKLNLRVLWWFNKLAGASIIVFVMVSMILMLSGSYKLL